MIRLKKPPLLRKQETHFSSSRTLYMTETEWKQHIRRHNGVDGHISRLPRYIPYILQVRILEYQRLNCLIFFLILRI